MEEKQLESQRYAMAGNHRLSFQGFDKPLRSEDSIHVPGHILMPPSSLMAHPYPGAVHPVENQQGERSVSDIRSMNDSRQWFATSPAMWNPTRCSLSSQDLENAFPATVGKHRRRCSVASIREHAKEPVIVTALPILPLQAAVVCLIFNILIPGLGKFLILLLCFNFEKFII